MRRKHRQIIAMFTIVIMLLPLLAGCGSEVSDLPEMSTQGAEEVVTTEVPDEETQEPIGEDIEPLIEVELPLNEIKREVHTLSWGEEDGQLGWNDSEIFGIRGPDFFIVEDGIICVLDNAQFELLIYKGGDYTEVDTSIFGIASDIKYQDQRIGVASGNNRFLPFHWRI